ncbi:NUDIX domain-containing protein [Paenibacillus mesophilus]|uniref:NUDIX hydrolase n=1 Tax=Paenibacillus mesophilus TaxID=2582849 RepID=UPI00110D3B88|nr:NUDIX domain-containing protein [Paenibacillus mesophilus]TMV50321.1 NUDIX domain-containing protein [Paenibacillus mesophilus]
MKLLAEIAEEDIGYEMPQTENNYRVRKASRAIVVNALKQIALLYVSKQNYHKLPGGGIERGESIADALSREIMEEVGVEIKVNGEVGLIIEYRDRFELLQISYCFFASMERTKEGPSFTEEEQQDGFELKWVELEEAIELVRDDVPTNYVGRFIQKRDYAFLRAFQERK